MLVDGQCLYFFTIISLCSSPIFPQHIPIVYPHHTSPWYLHYIPIIYIYIPSISLNIYALYPQCIPIRSSLYTNYISPLYIYVCIFALYPHYILIISSLHPHYTCSLYLPEYIYLEQKSPLIDFHSRFCKLCHMSYIPSLGSITRVLTGMNHQVL